MTDSRSIHLSTGKKLLDIDLGRNFLDMTPKAQATKQVGLHQTKKLLHSERNHQQNGKATYEMGENTCKPCIG